MAVRLLSLFTHAFIPRRPSSLLYDMQFRLADIICRATLVLHHDRLTQDSS